MLQKRKGEKKKNTINLTGPVGAKHIKYWIVLIFQGINSTVGVSRPASRSEFSVCLRRHSIHENEFYINHVARIEKLTTDKRDYDT